MKIRVSRHGLTECPSCSRHIRVATEWQETRCPFCGAGLLAATRDRASSAGLFSALRIVVSGRAVAGAILAVGLAVGGCDAPARPIGSGTRADASRLVADASGQNADAAPGPDVQLADAADPGPQPEYGLPPPVDAGFADSGDPGPQPLYGLPPPDAGQAADAGPQPMYGLPPPDAGMARRDAGLIDAGDPGPQPLYGLPPPDGGVRPRPDAGFDPDAADASPIQPLYGLPPPRDAG